MAAQDMPPPGGFGFIPVERTLPRPLLRQSILFGIGVVMSIGGILYLREWRKRYRVLRIEESEHYIATLPFLLAEQERKYLLRLRYLRDRERELMKDHPGWIVGTLYGEKVYKTLPEGALPAISAIEFAQDRPIDEWTYKISVPTVLK